MLDRIGCRLQGALDTVESTAGRWRVGPALFGAAMAVGIVGAGIAAFIVVLIVLVELVP